MHQVKHNEISRTHRLAKLLQAHPLEWKPAKNSGLPTSCSIGLLGQLTHT